MDEITEYLNMEVEYNNLYAYGTSGKRLMMDNSGIIVLNK